jgi:hypothetical protein
MRNALDAKVREGKKRTRTPNERASLDAAGHAAVARYDLALMQLWHVLAVACVAADLDVRPAGTLSTASRKRLGGKTRAAIGLGVGFAVVPRRAQEMYSQYKPRTAEAWRKRMIQRRAVVPLNERAPSILAVAFTCSVLMVRPHTLEFECCAPNSSHWRASSRH